MPKGYMDLQKIFEIRETRYKESIERLNNQIQDKDIRIKELEMQVKHLQDRNKYLSELVARIDKYSDIDVSACKLQLDTEKEMSKHKLFNFIFKSKGGK